MALRHSGSDLMSSLIENVHNNEDNWITYKPDNSDTDEPTERSYSMSKHDKIAPVLTNFGLDSLSVYLQEKLRENKLRTEKLRHEPQLAALEAEKQELKKIVNSHRSVEACVQQGRLIVRAQNINSHGRSHSAPPSEGDNEMGSRKFGNIPGLAKGKAAVIHNAKSWGTRPRRRLTNPGLSFQDQGSLRSIHNVSGLVDNPMDGPSQQAQDSGCDDNDENDDNNQNNVSQCRRSSFRRPLRSQECLDSLSTPPPQVSMSDLFVNLSQDTLTRRQSEFGMSTPSVSSDRLESRRSLPHATPGSQDFLNASDSHVVNKARGRSLSFEKYADEFRHSVRSSKLQVKEDIENRGIEEDDDSPRPRKVTSSKNNSRLDPEASESKPVTSLATEMTTSALKSIHSNSPICQLSSNDAAFMLSAQSDNIGYDHFQNVNLPDFEISADTQSDGTGAVMTSSLFDDLKLGKSLTGKDTFYSASSEETTSISDKEADVSTAINDEDKGKGKLVVKPKQQTMNDTTLSLVPEFEYNSIVPEDLPSSLRQARDNYNKIWSLVGLDDRGHTIADKSDLWYTTQYSLEELSPDGHNILGAQDSYGQFPRNWRTSFLPVSPKDPPICASAVQRDGFALEILPLICRYLSSQEIRNLRLVNRSTASALLPFMIRSTVFKFGQTLFNSTNNDGWDSKSNTPALNSLLQTYGSDINKFGISFEVDSTGLANSKVKVIEEEVSAWFGNYTWPKERYPRFSELKELEDLVDGHRPLLKNTMKNLTNVSELALSIDSGHGWLNGPDVSDMALIRERQQGGSKIFGKTFDAPDRWNEFALRQFFRWAQLNTINANSKRLGDQHSRSSRTSRKTVRRFRVCDYDDYRVQVLQHDFNRSAHTGGDASSAPQQGVAGGAGSAAPALTQIPALFLQPPMPPIPPNALPLWMGNQGPQPHMNGLMMPPVTAPNGSAPVTFAPQPPFPVINNFLPSQTVSQNRRAMRMRQQRNLAKGTSDDTRSSPIVPQWPLIFNCFNLAGQMGGNHACVQNAVFTPTAYPYLPAELTETQVQWLMETLWAQRAFLSAYTNSIITNAGVFKNVHSLNIAKLSSGLIPSLAQTEFWSSLTGLKKLTLKILPDWRQEHVPGDKFYHRNMPVSPAQAASKLAHLLKSYVSKLENLSVLRTGFVGGGEHQTGIFARNCHILPAPITSDVHAWLSDHETKPDPRKMFAFNHIRDLTFENCWLSPCMLEAFMIKSRDTSLHHLTLDSVSLTGVHDVRNDGPLSVESHSLRCEFSPSEWLHEAMPRSACWVNVIESITPGKTILQRKYDAEMIDEEANPRPEPHFRGNIKKITFNSCGYAKISGVRADHFSQNGLVEQSNPACAVDEGLTTRKQSFYMTKTYESRTNSASDRSMRNTPFRRRFSESTKEVSLTCIMMSAKEFDSRQDYFGLGKLTQAVHPIEKRVLERAWGMRFGWGDTMERWAAVEDGWFEGGTGRFSGTIEREDED